MRNNSTRAQPDLAAETFQAPALTGIYITAHLAPKDCPCIIETSMLLHFLECDVSPERTAIPACNCSNRSILASTYTLASSP